MPPVKTTNQHSRVFLGFGGNIENPLTHFRWARKHLSAQQRIELVACAPLYRTPPLGGPDGQPDFLNTALEIRTDLPARDLLKLCQELEYLAGRDRDAQWGPRPLDIDLLLFADRVSSEPELTLPHPRMHQRHFVLLPLCDLDEHILHPRLKQTCGSLLRQLPPAPGISKLQTTW